VVESSGLLNRFQSSGNFQSGAFDAEGAALSLWNRARCMASSEYLQSIVEQDALPPVQKNVVSEPTRREGAVRRILEFSKGITSASANR
jgi:hypothetical protein